MKRALKKTQKNNVKGEHSFFTLSRSLSIQSIISPNSVLLRKNSRITTDRPASAAVVRRSPAAASCLAMSDTVILRIR
jgi:hypothetical protein